MFSSGMAAVTTTLLKFLKAADHIIYTDDIYRKTLLILSETPTNPYLRVVDYEKLVRIANIYGLWLSLFYTRVQITFNKVTLEN